VEQSLHPVDYVWRQKQHSYSYVHIVLALRLPGMTLGY